MTLLQDSIQALNRDVFFSDDTGMWSECSYRPTHDAVAQTGKRIIPGAEIPSAGDGFTLTAMFAHMCDDATIGISGGGPVINGYIDIAGVPWRIADVEGDGAGIWALQLAKGEDA